MENLYPVFLDLHDKTILVIGGGTVATRKVQSLLLHTSSIKIVSPVLSKPLCDMALKSSLRVYKRPFQSRDLRGVSFVFSATNQTQLNHKIALLCKKRRILINSVDDPSHCDFIVPSVLRRDSLVVAISTEGNCPVFAVKLRQKLEEMIPPIYGELVSFLGQFRQTLIKKIPYASRKDIFCAMIYPEIFKDLATKDLSYIKQQVHKCISK